MAVKYSRTAPKLKAAKLDKRALLAIGRLIRACAEVEDLLNLFIYRVSGLDESRGVVIFGKMNARSRLALANQLAEMHSQSEAEAVKECFKHPYAEVIETRNAVAHGVLLGKTSEARWAFLTTTIAAQEIDNAGQVVIAYRTVDIEEHAKSAERAIPLIEARLKVEPSRQRRLQLGLHPHPKAQPQRGKSAKHQPPPRS